MSENESSRAHWLLLIWKISLYVNVKIVGACQIGTNVGNIIICNALRKQQTRRFQEISGREEGQMAGRNLNTHEERLKLWQRPLIFWSKQLWESCASIFRQLGGRKMCDIAILFVVCIQRFAMKHALWSRHSLQLQNSCLQMWNHVSMPKLFMYSEPPVILYYASGCAFLSMNKCSVCNDRSYRNLHASSLSGSVFRTCLEIHSARMLLSW